MQETTPYNTSACSWPSVQHQNTWAVSPPGLTPSPLLITVLQASSTQHCSTATSNLLLGLSLTSPRIIIIIQKSAKDCLIYRDTASISKLHIFKTLMSQFIVSLAVNIFLFHIKTNTSEGKLYKKHVRQCFPTQCGEKGMPLPQQPITHYFTHSIKVHTALIHLSFYFKSDNKTTRIFSQRKMMNLSLRKISWKQRHGNEFSCSVLSERL